MNDGGFWRRMLSVSWRPTQLPGDAVNGMACGGTYFKDAIGIGVVHNALHHLGLYVRESVLDLCKKLGWSGLLTEQRKDDELQRHHPAGQLNGQVIKRGFDWHKRSPLRPCFEYRPVFKLRLPSEAGTRGVGDKGRTL